jgi:hypothetical protein
LTAISRSPPSRVRRSGRPTARAVEWRDGTQAFALRKNLAWLATKDSQALSVNVRDQIAEMVNVNNFTINLPIE